MDAKKTLCTSCKLILPGEFRYCPICGEPVTDRAAPSHAPPYEPPHEDENPILLERLSGALTGRKAIIIGVIVLALIVIGAIAVVSLTQRQQSQPIVVSSETPTPTPKPSPTVPDPHTDPPCSPLQRRPRSPLPHRRPIPTATPTAPHCNAHPVPHLQAPKPHPTTPTILQY